MKDVDGSVDRDGFAARAVKHPDGNTYWDPMDVYRLLGSNMHVVMQPQLWVSGDPLELFPGVGWESVLDSVVDALKVLALGEDDDELTGNPRLDFFTFFFLLPDPSGPVSSGPPSNYCVPTPFLRGLVVHGMCTVELSQRRALLRKLQSNGQLRDAVFEAAALAHISEAHVTVRVRGVLPASRSLVIGPPASGPAYVVYEDKDPQQLLPSPASENCKRAAAAAVECDLYAKPVPCIPDQPGFYLCPPGFPGIDAVILADGEGEGEVPARYEIIVRAIVEAKPTSSNVNQRGIDIITKALDQHTAPRKRTRLFLFVSDTAEKSEKLMETKVPGWTVGSVTLTAQDLVGSVNAI